VTAAPLRRPARPALPAVLAALAALAALGSTAPGAGAQAVGPDSTVRADTSAIAPDTTSRPPFLPLPASADTAESAGPVPVAPLRTRTATRARRGGPYNVVADRLEGGRTALEGEVIMLIGNVTLSREGTVVKAHTGRYVKRDGTIYLTGGVDAVDGRTRINSLEAAYNEASDFLTLTGQVVVRDGDLVIHADNGSYDQSRGRAELWSRVRAVQGARTLTADRVIHLRDDEVVQARGRVVARDSTDKLTLTAEAVDYDRRRELAFAMPRPRLVQDPRDGKGATTVVGDTIVVDTRAKVATAIGRVEVTRDSLRAEAGRLVFDDREQRGVLTGAPRAWTDEVTVRGDTLEAFTRERALERLRVTSRGEIEYRAREGEEAGERSLLTADRIDAWLDREDEGVDSLYAVGNATNEYVGKPAPGRLAESNRTTGATVRLQFEGREVVRAIVTGEAKGTYRPDVAAGDTAAVRRETVEYGADRIVFEVPKDRIRLDQNAVLRYQDIALRAPEVVFDVEGQVLEARGNPQLEDRGDTLRGRALAYDLEGRRGVIYGARTRYQSGWYSGDRIRRLGDDVLDVSGASYSTCNLLDPHYAFRSDRMKIYLRDKIIARPVVFALKHIPLLALPFYVFPIRQERASGLLVPQIQFGFGGSSGGYIRNAGYYWAPNEYLDLTAAGDWYPQLSKWFMRGEARYKLLYRFEGQFQGSFSRDLGTNVVQTGWDFRGNHGQTLGENTSLTAQANFTSSADYTNDPDAGLPLANRVDRQLHSTAALSHRGRGWAASVIASRDENLDVVPTSTARLTRLREQLPSFSAVLTRRALGRAAGSPGGASSRAFLASTYLGANARFVNDRSISTFLRDSTVIDTTVAQQAYQQVVSLSDNRRLGFVNVGPTFQWTQVVYGRDATGKALSTGGTWNTGASASLTLYGTSRRGLGPVTSVRHVFNPSFSYNYQPEFERLRVRVPVADSFTTVNRFPGVGGIFLAASEQSFLGINLSNRFEAKVRSGDEEKTLTNLLAVDVSTAYDFLHERGSRGTPWQPISTSIRVNPPTLVAADASLLHDPIAGKVLRQARANLSLRFAGGGRAPAVADLPLAGNEAQTRRTADPLVPWAASIQFSYAGGRGALEGWEHREQANLVARVQPTPNWTLNYQNLVDLNRREIVYQEWSVTRNLHCWQAMFVRRFSGGVADYLFRISILERPEIFIDRGTTGIGTLGGLGNLGGIGETLAP
jgi:lipopolysaccharide assembly outer membrane protein LptD (OstA)